MTNKLHPNGQQAWTGYAAFHANGNQAWTTEGICYHDNQQQAWTGFTAYDRQGNQKYTNNHKFELKLGSGFVIKHDEPVTSLFLNGQKLTSKDDYKGISL